MDSIEGWLYHYSDKRKKKEVVKQEYFLSLEYVSYNEY